MSLEIEQCDEWMRVVRSPDDTYLVGANGQRFEFSDVPWGWQSGKETNGWIQTCGAKQGLFVKVKIAESFNALRGRKGSDL